MPATFTTFTQRKVDLLNLQIEDIDIRDIAHQLACTNRFGGGAAVPINVALHSVWVSRLVTDSCKLAGLLHDASEAYLGDVVYHLKRAPVMEPYLALESLVQGRILSKFGVAPGSFDQSHIDWADLLMCRWEAEVGYPGHPQPLEIPKLTQGERRLLSEWRGLSEWRWMDWQESESVFLSTFFDLMRH